MSKSAYEDISETIMRETQAELVTVMIMHGNKGTGLSVTVRDEAFSEPERRQKTAMALRMTADMLEGKGLQAN